MFARKVWSLVAEWMTLPKFERGVGGFAVLAEFLILLLVLSRHDVTV
jgi:hypothetical protein